MSTPTNPGILLVFTHKRIVANGYVQPLTIRQEIGQLDFVAPAGAKCYAYPIAGRYRKAGTKANDKHNSQVASDSRDAAMRARGEVMRHILAGGQVWVWSRVGTVMGDPESGTFPTVAEPQILAQIWDVASRFAVDAGADDPRDWIAESDDDDLEALFSSQNHEDEMPDALPLFGA